MKFHDDGESFGVEATRRDVELARAARDGLEVVAGVAETLGYRSGGETAECQGCQEERVLRPFPVAGPEGDPVLADVCEECQSNLAEQHVIANRGKAPEPDEPVIEEAEGVDA